MLAPPELGVEGSITSIPSPMFLHVEFASSVNSEGLSAFAPPNLGAGGPRNGLLPCQNL